MKKIFLLAAVLLFAMTSAALAYFEEVKSQEGADIVKVERLAIASALYTPTKPDTPTPEEFMAILSAAGKKASKREIITYDEIAELILSDTGKDIRTLERRVAAKVFRDNVKKYADGYLVTTVTMSRRTMFFFEVYGAGTNDFLYAYEMITDSDEPDDEKTYTLFAEKFFKNFDWSTEEQRKEQKKAAREADRKRAREERKRAA